MSNFTRSRYDGNEYRKALNESTYNYHYNLDPPNFQCNSSFGPDDVNVESYLLGLGQRSNNGLYVPSMPNTNCNQYPDDFAHNSEYSRFLDTRPVSEISTFENQLDYPIYDPQCHIFTDFSMNSRNHTKDNHRTIWQVPLSQMDALPVERLGVPKICQFNCM